MELPFATLDVFTSHRMQGNPLAVVTVPAALRDKLGQDDKQRVAREFNLSETVFLHEAARSPSGGSDGGGGSLAGRRREVDIFTVDREIPFAGHPTVGTAVWCLAHEEGGGGGALETLVTKAGPIAITSSPSPSASGGQTTVSVSARIPHNVRVHAHTLADIVGYDGKSDAAASSATSSSSSSPPPPEIPGLSADPAIRRAELTAPVVSIVKGMTFLLVKLDSLEMLGRVVVSGLDYESLSSLPSAAGAVGNEGARGEKKALLDEGWRDSLVARYYYVDVPSGGGEGDDELSQEGQSGEEVRQLRTRMIEFNMEDPATGSAASALACYLTLKDGAKATATGSDGDKRRRFVMTQGVEMGRKSVISLETSTTRSASGEVSIDEVHLGGTAVVVMRGVLTV